MKEQPKRLGRGLAALLGEATVPMEVTAAGVQSLGVELLEPSPFQPRREMDEAALEELAASIGQRGILQPLLVRPKPGVEGRYQIIAGERRWRAAQRARLHDVPVLVRPLTDADAMAAGLVENLQREDLNPVEEAQGFQRLMGEFELTQEALAEAVGKSRAHIANLVRLLKLPEPVLAMLRDGSLSVGQAKAVMAHANPVRAAREVVKKQMTVRQAEQFVEDAGRTIKGGVLSHPIPKRQVHEEARQIEDQLAEHLGIKIKVSFDGKAGSISLAYKSLDQLDWLIKLLLAAG